MANGRRVRVTTPGATRAADLRRRGSGAERSGAERSGAERSGASAAGRVVGTGGRRRARREAEAGGDGVGGGGGQHLHHAFNVFVKRFGEDHVMTNRATMAIMAMRDLVRD